MPSKRVLILVDGMISQPAGSHRLSEFVRMHYGRSDWAQTALLALPHVASLEAAVLQARLHADGKSCEVLECAFRTFQKPSLHALLREAPDEIVIPTKFYFSPDFLRNVIAEIRAAAPKARIILEGHAPLSFPEIRAMVDGTVAVDRLSPVKLWPASRESHEFFPIVAHAGCDFHCSYCGHRELEPGLRRRDPQEVKEELLHNWNSAGIRKYWFQDAIVSGDSELFRMLAALPFRIEWIGNARTEHIGAESARALAKSGCIGLFLGIESGDPETLKRYGRPHDLERISRAVDILRDNGILSSASWLVDERDGLSDPFKRTAEFAASLRCDLNVVNTLTGGTTGNATKALLREFVSAGLQLGVVYDVAWGSTAGLTKEQSLEFFGSPTKASCELVFVNARKHPAYRTSH